MSENDVSGAEISGRTLYDEQTFMFEDETYRQGQQMRELRNTPGFKETVRFTPKYSKDQIEQARKKASKRTISKLLSSMSRFGLSFDEQVVKNMRAIPADKNMLPDEQQADTADLFGAISSAWSMKSNKDKSFFEKDFAQKRDTLRALAMQPELEDILDTMTNEAIVYDSNYTYFAEPYIDENDMSEFSKETKDKISKSVSKTFRHLYRVLNWRTAAWDDFKRFLIDGILAWEIVYDSLEKPTKILGLVPLDPATLTKKFANDKWYWIQFKGVTGRERRLLDSQVVYIQFQESGASVRMSYLERLIRPYNVYRIIEQAQIIWCVTNASYRMKFTIPVKGMNKAMSSQTINSAMNRYREDIKFVSESGELSINGRAQMPFNKEYWMPENEAGTPEIETLGGDGPELMDSDYLKYFKNQLYKTSKIPLNRFDQDNAGEWFGTDASSYARTEIDFARYVQRLRNLFIQVMIKPLCIQLVMDVPELLEHREFLECVQMHYNSYNVFEEMMEIELMAKRVEHIQNMKESLVDMDADGNDVSFFSSKYLVKKYLKFSDQDIELNQKMKQEEIEELNLAGDENNTAESLQSIKKSLNEAKEQIKELRSKLNKS